MKCLDHEELDEQETATATTTQTTFCRTNTTGEQVETLCRSYSTAPYSTGKLSINISCHTSMAC